MIDAHKICPLLLLANLVLLYGIIVNGFLAPVASRINCNTMSDAPTCREGLTSLLLKVERYGVPDESDSLKKKADTFVDSDEALFVSLTKDGKINESDTASKAYEDGIKSPTPELEPGELVPLIMNALRNNNTPDVDAGIRLIWEFSTDTTKHVFQNNITGEHI